MGRLRECAVGTRGVCSQADICSENERTHLPPHLVSQDPRGLYCLPRHQDTHRPYTFCANHTALMLLQETQASHV